MGARHVSGVLTNPSIGRMSFELALQASSRRSDVERLLFRLATDRTGSEPVSS